MQKGVISPKPYFLNYGNVRDMDENSAYLQTLAFPGTPWGSA